MTWNQALRDHIDLSIRECRHQEARWFCSQDTKAAVGGPQWLEEMLKSLNYIKQKEDAGLLKVMLYSDIAKLYVPELF